MVHSFCIFPNTFVFRFTPHQQEVCDENYKKKCTIVFVTQSQRETVRMHLCRLSPKSKVDDSHQSPTSQVQKCYRPLEKQCSGEGPEECRDYPETICTTRYTKKASGKFVQVNSSIKCKQLHWSECS